MDTKIQFIVSKLKHRLDKIYGARLRKLILYGSHARGEAIAGSDIDVLLILDECRDFWSEFEKIEDLTSQISLEHDIVVSVFPMSERDYQERQTPFLLNVRREGMLVP
ncbi:MAG TPA: nucleotidyltransferase domain-containing protein [Nitrospiria bacterium]